jgi:serine/threonine protein phosphatase 1
MQQLFVVGDIHGCARELEALLGRLPLSAGDTIVFLGDYVDRGSDAKAVVEQLLALASRTGITAVFLKGNHEDMFLAFLGRGGHYGDAFLYNGGVETLASYGIHPRTPPSEVAAALPRAHSRFLDSLSLTHVAPPYLMVHAGIDPERDLAAQSPEDLLWIREPFIRNPHTLSYTVCFGHTPVRDVWLDLPYKIGLDTGCVYGNRLSCIETREPRVFQVAAGSRRVEVRDLADRFRLPRDPA